VATFLPRKTFSGTLMSVRGRRYLWANCKRIQSAKAKAYTLV